MTRHGCPNIYIENTEHVTLTQSNYISHEILHVELRENMVSDLDRIRFGQ